MLYLTLYGRVGGDDNNIMAKYLKESNGVWAFVEEDSILSILSNKAGGLSVTDVSDAGSPKFTIAGAFNNPSRMLGDRVLANNEYNSLLAEVSPASEDNSIWEVKLWIFREQKGDSGLSELATEIVKLEKPDSMLYFSTSRTPYLMSEILQDSNVIALNKKYKAVVPNKFGDKLTVTGLYRTLTSQDKSPLICLEATALKVDITVKVDLFLDSLEVSYHYNNSQPRKAITSASEWLPGLSSKFFGKQANNTVLNSMRVHNFIEEQSNWNNAEFIEKILMSIDPIFLQNLK
jgi:hypothetical protein